MAKTWLVLDANYLCHRSFFAHGGLSYEDVKTGVVFGFLRDLIVLSKKFQTTRFAFCFDYGRGIRESINPEYKANRINRLKQLTIQQEEDRQTLQSQIRLLRDTYLPDLGYKNIFFQNGYEADDVIASVCRNVNIHVQCVIVSGDKDLYQCLAPNVVMYVPGTKELVTEETFHEEWGLAPHHWPKVKSIAGCGTDNVCGVPGVGEITAAKYVRGELPVHHQAYKDIRAMRDEWKENRVLVTLPLEGCIEFVLTIDQVDGKAWDRLCRSLGMASLEELGAAPGEPDFVSGRNRR